MREPIGTKLEVLPDVPGLGTGPDTIRSGSKSSRPRTDASHGSSGESGTTRRLSQTPHRASKDGSKMLNSMTFGANNMSFVAQLSAPLFGGRLSSLRRTNSHASSGSRRGSTTTGLSVSRALSDSRAKSEIKQLTSEGQQAEGGQQAQGGLQSQGQDIVDLDMEKMWLLHVQPVVPLELRYVLETELGRHLSGTSSFYLGGLLFMSGLNIFSYRIGHTYQEYVQDTEEYYGVTQDYDPHCEGVSLPNFPMLCLLTVLLFVFFFVQLHRVVYQLAVMSLSSLDTFIVLYSYARFWIANYTNWSSCFRGTSRSVLCQKSYVILKLLHGCI